MAVSDPLRVTVRPLTVLDGSKPDQGAEAVARIVRDQGAEVVVVGVPILASGEAGTQAMLVLEAVARLEPLVAVPVVLWEESYSTAEVARRRRDRGKFGAQGRDDAEAAAVLLEEWIAAGEPMDFRPIGLDE